MNRALWSKSLRDARGLLAASCALLFGFFWLQVWVIREVTPEQLLRMLSELPAFVRRLLPVPIEVLASERGRLAFVYDHPLVLLTLTAWAFVRGSDAVSGPLNRGTLEMVLAQPVRRTSVLAVDAAVTVLDVAALCASGFLGTWVGLRVEGFDHLSALDFLPAAGNFFALGLFLSGVTTLVSACDSYRWRTLASVGAFYVLSMVVKVVARASPRWGALAYTSFFCAYEPQVLVSQPAGAWTWRYVNLQGQPAVGGLGYLSVLAGTALLAYLAAAVVFARRDLPAPL